MAFFLIIGLRLFTRGYVDENKIKQLEISSFILFIKKKNHLKKI